MAVIQIGERTAECNGILFDKDGTLLDFMQLWGPWATTILNLTEQRLSELGTGFSGAREQVLGTRHDHEGRVIAYNPEGPLAMGTAEDTIAILAWQLYTAGLPWNEAMTQVRGLADQAMQELRQSRPVQALPGLQSFLEDCVRVGVKLAVVTSDGTREAEEQLEWAGLREYFDLILGYDQVTWGKPHPELAITASRTLGLHPEDTILIGDSNGDMQMGRQAGVRLAVGLSPDSGSSSHLADADVIIRDYHGIQVKE
ncbi:HAD family hydrolase [Paenibacillus sp. JX-17]|uniref:HAD family hydrolase n=1 Tax=Paenibacillus lacisoli TaxID=3064525 RepID=A0ABT9CFS7_9BACL|nr:HAD family hydrolase [Paenibacillus sp. JX-17]MDO7908133.1 HAD family hydrolase [Paenibacillus sp. JX-17]